MDFKRNLQNTLTAIASAALTWAMVSPAAGAEQPNPASGQQQTQAHFPSATFAVPSKSATSSLDASYKRAWQLVRDNTMFPERLGSWQSWEHKFDGKLTRSGDLELALNQMLGQLADQYTYFRNADQTSERCQTDEERGVVEHLKLAGRVGYIHIRTFCSHHVSEELQAALLDLSDCESLVLDLRENRGGYVEQALLAFSLLVENGKFVSIEGRQDAHEYLEHVFLGEKDVIRIVNGSTTRELRLPNLSGKKPLIVMVNDGTRSAAEMLAGALRDQRDARLIGHKTFGKGVVQGTWFLESGGSIKIAMARFYLPAGECINGKGLMPDVEAEFGDENAIKKNPEKMLNIALSPFRRYLAAK